MTGFDAAQELQCLTVRLWCSFRDAAHGAVEGTGPLRENSPRREHPRSVESRGAGAGSSACSFSGAEGPSPSAVEPPNPVAITIGRPADGRNQTPPAGSGASRGNGTS